MSVPTSIVRRDRHALGPKSDVAPTTRRSSLPVQQRAAEGRRQVRETRRPLLADALDDGEQPLLRATDDVVEEEQVPVRPIGKVTTMRSRGTPGRMIEAAPRSVNTMALLLGIVLVVIAVVGLVRFVLFVSDCLTDYHNTLTYGPNRTTVVSGVFGHNDSKDHPTYVVAINVKGTLLIEEVPGGDVSRTKVYPTGITLVGDNAQKLPVVLTVRHVSGDRRLDVLIQIPGQSAPLALINTGTGFTLVAR